MQSYEDFGKVSVASLPSKDFDPTMAVALLAPRSHAWMRWETSGRQLTTYTLQGCKSILEEQSQRKTKRLLIMCAGRFCKIHKSTSTKTTDSISAGSSMTLLSPAYLGGSRGGYNTSLRWQTVFQPGINIWNSPNIHEDNQFPCWRMNTTILLKPVLISSSCILH